MKDAKVGRIAILLTKDLVKRTGFFYTIEWQLEQPIPPYIL